MGVMLSVLFTTFRIAQKYIQYQKEESAFQLIEAALVSYFFDHRSFPKPDGNIVNENGILKGEWPVNILGELSVKVEYYVDERVTEPLMKSQGAFYCIKGNRMLCVPSNFMIPFVVKTKDKLFYLSNAVFISKHFPSLMTKGDSNRNLRGEPEFKPN